MGLIWPEYHSLSIVFNIRQRIPCCPPQILYSELGHGKCLFIIIIIKYGRPGPFKSFLHLTTYKDEFKLIFIGSF